MTSPIDTSPIDQGARDTIRTEFAETLFVEAGAGTGKTTALVARVIHMVATGHLGAMSELAAITFTENAAAELRNRIREGLQPDEASRYAGFEYDAAAQVRLAAGLETLDDAVLTTLHGFASRILSEASLEAGLPPGFSVADTGSGTEDAERSWSDFLDRLLDDQAIREHLLCGLTLGLKLGDLNAVATALGASWDRLCSQPLAVVKLPSVSADDVLTHLTEAFADEGHWPDGDALAQHLGTTIRSLIAELTPPGHPLDLLDLLETLSTADIKCSGGRAPDWKAAGLDKPQVVQALKDADEARNNIVQGVGAAVTETLAARVQDWLLDESERRRDSGALGYHDLLVLARDVLRTDPEVRQRLHDQWPTLLIDEFQDTDPIQAEIAYLLAGPHGVEDPGVWADIAVESGRLFFVGDAKQSIYRFRRADLEVFTAVGDQHVPARLKVNFRSVPGVLDAANAAFGVLIGQDPNAGIDYADLEPSREATSDIPPVLLIGGPLPGTSMAALRQLESAHLADVAVRAKREGWKIPGGTASYKDMAILLPTRTSLPTLERALQDRDVPYRIESRSLVWSTDAVRGLIAILAAVDSPADEVALIAALRNPGLACSDVDLVTWRAAGGRWSLFAPTPAGLAEHPVATALATMRDWHQSRWWLPANQLVEKIVRELRLVELTASQRRPRDHWRRLRFVVDQSREWCDNGGSGLGSFVVWALQQMDNDADLLETVVPETDDDAVRILTIHGAKGLEFPITMVAGLAGGAGRQPQVLWADEGPQIRFKAGTLETRSWGAAVLADKEAARREGIRLLYVAATRAMDHLVLGCYHAPPVSPTSQRSSAQQLWDLLSKGGLARIESGIGHPLDALKLSGGPAPRLPTRADFATDRQALLDAVCRRVATSPTSLGVQSPAAAVVLADETALEPDKADDEDVVEPTEASPTPARVWRSSSQGKAIGTATHRVLELVNLTTPSVDEVRSLARLACAEQGIPELQADIEGRVWSALHDDALQSALDTDTRTLSEVYFVAQDGERFLEGYIDLLVDGGPGSLAILDYKTDKATSDAEVEAKKARYAPQLAAYARAVEQITGRTPSSTDLVFARPGGRPTPLTDEEPST
jgi:ATP-dependent helicase/nuclease subunit A